MSDSKETCPTLYQLVAEFRAFKDWTKDMLSEREKLSTERATGIAAQFTAMKDNTAIAFANAEKAGEKTEAAQKEYNIRSNEFRQALDDAQKNAVSTRRFDDFRKEYEAFKLSQASEIRTLREARSTSEGKSTGISTTWAVILALVMAAFAAVGLFLKK